MSAAVFRYFMEADEAQQEDMGVTVDPSLQQFWRDKIEANPSAKLDDAGDAMLHALNEILCGGSNYRQLVPDTAFLHSNRTVVVIMLPTLTHWTVLHCTWNLFEVEYIGLYESHVEGVFFKNRETVEVVKRNIPADLRTALTDVSGSDLYHPVDHIKVVVKQLRGRPPTFTNLQAGSLTNAVVNAMKQLCDESVGSHGQLCDRSDTVFGAVYVQTDLETGHKFQVVRSTGKHTNAILSFLGWMNDSAKRFVELRTNVMTLDEKLCFFNALEAVALSDDNRLEMLLLSQKVKEQLTQQTLSVSSKRIIADLILVGVNVNQQKVKAVAANYRHQGSRQ